MKQHFLFGEDACIVLNEEHKSLRKKANAIKKTSHAIYVWDEFETPTSLLEFFLGWGDFERIDKELYDLLNQ